VLELRLQGYSNPEIAEQLGCARQTVRLKVQRIQEVLEQMLQSDAHP